MFLAADKYLLGHGISVMRVRRGSNIVCDNRVGGLRSYWVVINNTDFCFNSMVVIGDGVMALLVDWYSLSLANVLFAWRRDTGLTSTFARVCSATTAVCLKVLLR